MNIDELKTCPFCGGEVHIIPCDNEGNIHLEEGYQEHPWSGLAFGIMHDEADIPEEKTCPIASFEEDGSILGTFTYDTKEEAINTWNQYKNTNK